MPAPPRSLTPIHEKLDLYEQKRYTGTVGIPNGGWGWAACTSRVLSARQKAH
jgi:hypothetical protein